MTQPLQAGGALQPESLYIARPADEELFAAARAGRFCYVLAPRQIGKSSLRLRTSIRLKELGVACASIDLGGMGGSSATQDAWFYSFLSEIQRSLRNAPDLAAFWRDHSRMTVVARFSRYLDECLAAAEQDIVIFVDEIDETLALPFPREDFFGAIRALYNARSEGVHDRRMTFCLFGVAAPADLMSDIMRTPFNIGLGIALNDFSLSEMMGLLAALGGKHARSEELVAEVFKWTEGHPYMTLAILQRFVEFYSVNSSINIPTGVNKVVDELFLESGLVDEANLTSAARNFERANESPRVPKMLALYRRLLDGNTVATISNDPVQLQLRLTGVAAERHIPGMTVLRVRNKVFSTVFDLEWVTEQEADRFLASPLALWRDNGRMPEHLLEGEVLRRAQEWARKRQDLTPVESDFIQASLNEEITRSKERQKRDQRTKRQLTMLIAAVCGALAFMILVLVRNRQLDKAEAQATEDLRKANRDLQDKGKQAEIAERKMKLELARSKNSEAYVVSQTNAADRDSLSEILVAALDAGAARDSVDKPDQPTIPFFGITAATTHATSGRARVPLGGHTATVTGIAFSPDHRLVATVSKDQVLWMSDAVTGAPLWNRKEHTASIWSVAFSSDSRYVATGSYDYHVIVHDAQTGAKIRCVDLGREAIDIAFDPTRPERLLTAAYLQRAQIWDINSLPKDCHESKLYKQEPATPQSIYTQEVQWAPDGTRVVSTHEAGAVLWNVVTDKVVALRGHVGGLDFARFSADGKLIATVGQDGRTLLFDGQTGVPIPGSLPNHQPAKVKLGLHVAFSSGPKPILATSGDDGFVHLTDLETRKPLPSLSLGAPITRLVFGSDDSLVTGTADGIVRIWRARDARVEAQLRIESVDYKGSKAITALATAEGSVAVGDNSGRTLLWRRPSDPVDIFEHHTIPVTDLAFGNSEMLSTCGNGTQRWQLGKMPVPLDPNRRHLAAVFGSDGIPVAVDALGDLVRQSQPPRTTNVGARSITLVALAEVAKDDFVILYMSSPSDETPFLARVTAGLLVDRKALVIPAIPRGPKAQDPGTEAPPHKARPRALAVSKKRVAFAADNVVTLFDLGGTYIEELRGHAEDVQSLTFSSDGELLMSGASDGSVKVWWTDPSWKSIDAPISLHDDAVTALAISEDKRLFALGGKHGVIQIGRWDLADLKGSDPRFIVLEGSSPVRSLRFSGTKSLAAGYDDGSVLVFPLVPDRYYAAACEELERMEKLDDRHRARCGPQFAKPRGRSVSNAVRTPRATD